ncbi:uncharacterized histidine-rich protein DDB_G0274557-like [Drosophila elegans]|uniref:uncharacterized histidine-rich protein DDB_G0274557-like n=1 Tax=Drosophila elegans TaxID=30023 RepID=UPI001BC86A13|nr:uncharacterized histidine-rich protein DDB_G0274557-like [Drosophila elegans]
MPPPVGQAAPVPPSGSGSANAQLEPAAYACVPVLPLKPMSNGIEPNSHQHHHQHHHQLQTQQQQQQHHHQHPHQNHNNPSLNTNPNPNQNQNKRKFSTFF